MSSLGDVANPYLGSKISLISKSEIRYEGTLYSVDNANSTIALSDVRSFGTEHRKSQLFIPPRTEVFECVIFKADDVKDLEICSRNQAVAALGDPAIVAVRSWAPAKASCLGNGGGNLPPACAALLPATTTPATPVMPTTTVMPATMPAGGERKGTLTPASGVASESLDSGERTPPPGYDGGPVKLRYNHAAPRHPRPASQPMLLSGRPGRLSPFQSGSPPSMRLRSSAEPFRPAGLTSPGLYPPPRYARYSPSTESLWELPELCSVSPGGYPREAPFYGPRPLGAWDCCLEPPPLDSDYDFEGANAAFLQSCARSGLREVGTKGAIAKGEPSAVEAEVKSYEPGKSFFDRISGHSILVRGGYQRGLEKNLETFGETGLERSHFAPEFIGSGVFLR